MQVSDDSVSAHKQQIVSSSPGRLRRVGAYFKSRANCCACGCALVAVAAAILFPVFAKFPEGDHHGSCVSNVRQIGLALLQYAQDYDDALPCGTRSNRRGEAIVKDTPLEAKYHAGQGWAGETYPYLKSASVFICPDVLRAMRHNAPARRGTNGFIVEPTGPVPVSYAYNRNAALNPALHKFTTPEQTVLLCEVTGSIAPIQDGEEANPENRYSPAGNGLSVLASTDGETEAEAAGGVRYATGILGGYGHTPGCTYWPFYAPQTEPRHGKSAHTEAGSIYGMADGHVKFFTPERVSPGDNALAAQSGQDCVHHRASDAEHLKDFAVTFSTR